MSRIIRLAAASLVLLCTACAQLDRPPEPVPVPEAELVPLPAPAARAAPKPPEPVAILVSGKSSLYREVAAALERDIGRPYRVLNVQRDAAERVRARLDEQPPATVVAIGERALRLANEYRPKRLIYCQVFMGAPEDPSARGVAPLPPFAMQIEYWKSLAPNLGRIGLVGSSRLEPAIADIEAAAAAHGLEFRFRRVSSDKEALYVFQRLVPDIDGYLFLPDTSVLSPKVILAMVHYARKHGVQILTYNQSLFDLGATLYVSADHDDVARQVLNLLDDTNRKGGEVPLTRMVTQLNRAEAERLGLLLPAAD